MTFGEGVLILLLAFVLAIFSIVGIIWLIGRIATKKVRKIGKDVKAVGNAVKRIGSACKNAGSSLKNLKGNFKKKGE